MRLHLLTTLAAALAVALFLLACACGQAPAGTQSAIQPEPNCAPLQVSVGIDKTGSAVPSRTPQPKAADFAPLYGKLMTCGGELAVTVFGSRDNGPLQRLRIEPPAPMPADADPNLNPLEYDDQRNQKREERALAETRNQAREKEAATRIQAFDASLEDLLAKPADARCSDIASGLRRLARFHNEPTALWGDHPPRKYLLASSDGDHNCGPRRLDPLPGVRVLAVNGMPGRGILGELGATPLEGFDAAVRLITQADPTKEKE